MKGRVYDPSLGRFISADPFIQAPENTQSYNRYSYVVNNPLRYTDPSGYIFGIGRKIKKELHRFESKFRDDIKRFVAFHVASAAAVGGFVACGPSCAAGAYYGTYKGIRGYQQGLSPEDALMTAAFRGLQGYGVANIVNGAVMSFFQGYANDSVISGLYNVGESYAHHAANRYVRRQAEKFVQDQWGITLDQFNAGLLALSFAGNILFGDRKLDDFGASSKEAGIRGFLNRGNIVTGVFDTVDVALTYQGIPTATGLTAWWNGELGGYLKGHSLGASEVATLQGLGLISGGTVYALPFGRVAPGGVNVVLGNLDFVNGGYLGRIFNWDAQTVDVPFGAHSCRAPNNVYAQYGC